MLLEQRAVFSVLLSLLALAILTPWWPGRGFNLHRGIDFHGPEVTTQPARLHDVPSPVGTFKALLASTLSEQYTKTQRYTPPDTFPPTQFETIRGLFKSSVRINTHGPSIASGFRRQFGLPDNNGFVTAAILHNLLEAVTLCQSQTQAADRAVQDEDNMEPAATTRQQQQSWRRYHQKQQKEWEGVPLPQETVQPQHRGEQQQLQLRRLWYEQQQQEEEWDGVPLQQQDIHHQQKGEQQQQQHPEQQQNNLPLQLQHQQQKGHGTPLQSQPQSPASSSSSHVSTGYSQLFCSSLLDLVTDVSLAAAVEGLMELRDPRGGGEGGPLMGFWPWNVETPSVNPSTSYYHTSSSGSSRGGSRSSGGEGCVGMDEVGGKQMGEASKRHIHKRGCETGSSRSSSSSVNITNSSSSSSAHTTNGSSSNTTNGSSRGSTYSRSISLSLQRAVWSASSTVCDAWQLVMRGGGWGGGRVVRMMMSQLRLWGPRAGGGEQVPPHMWPVNVISVFTSNARVLDQLSRLLRVLRLTWLAQQLQHVAEGIRGGVAFFSLPPDADDTGCVQGLAWQLQHVASRFPLAASRSQQLADDPQAHLMKHYTSFAYRPHSKEFGASLIDPRSYYWLHDFIRGQQQMAPKREQENSERQQQQHRQYHIYNKPQQEDTVHIPSEAGTSGSGADTASGTEPFARPAAGATAEGGGAATATPGGITPAAKATPTARAAAAAASRPLDPSPISLISTWFQNPDSLLQERPWVQTPLLVNNIDAAVAANALYGITSALLLHPDRYLDPRTGQLDPEVQALVRNTTSMLLWVVESRVVVERADLVLLYYPTRWTFYGFLARWYKLLQRNAPRQQGQQGGQEVRVGYTSSGSSIRTGSDSDGAHSGSLRAGTSTGLQQQQQQEEQQSGGWDCRNSTLNSCKSSSSSRKALGMGQSPTPHHIPTASSASTDRAATSLPPELTDALPALERVLRGSGTEQLLEGAQQLLPGGRYWVWDGFVGNGDTSWGRPAPAYEDRVWATAVALNALMDIWSEEGADGAALSWHPDTPDEVQAVAVGAHQFLLEAADAHPKGSSYFSASIKAGLQGVLQLYPHNYACDLLNSSTCYSCGSIGGTRKGSSELQGGHGGVGRAGSMEGQASTGQFHLAHHLDPGGSGEQGMLVPGFGDYNTLTAVQGVMEEQEFKEKLRGRCMGMAVPRRDPGRNCGECVFPFWDSPGLTDSARMLALLKMQMILEADLPAET